MSGWSLVESATQSNGRGSMTTLAAIQTRTIPETQLEHVTPEIAREWLGRNTHNRTVNGLRVSRLAADIQAGAWAVNGDAIRWSATNELLDGQHRLHAIVKADRGIDTFVTRGLPAETQETMDTGARRKMRDILALRGETNVSSLGSVLGHIARIRTKNYTSNDPGLTNHTLLAMLDAEPIIREYAVLGQSISRSVPLSAGLAGALAYQFAEIDAEDCADFFAKLTSGSDLPSGHPALALRTRLFENKASKQQKLPRPHIHAMTVKAWNAYREGRDVAQLKWVRGGRTPEAFPEPV